MIITTASFKGGVGKSISCLHIANYLAIRRGANPVIVVDGDKNQTLIQWAERGRERLPFTVCRDHDVPDDFAGDLVIDTPGNIEDEQLLFLAGSSDLIVIPTLPAAFSLESTIATLARLSTLGKDRYRILLTSVPPKPSKAGERAATAIDATELPRFNQFIARRAVFQECELTGLPCNQLKGDAAAAAWKDYMEVGKELMKRLK